MEDGKKGFKGFTLLELIVAMAIIAVLIGLSLLGIQTVQRSSRDTQRRSTLEAINLEITDYYGANNQYPASISVASGTTPMLIGGAGGKTVPLNGAAGRDTAITSFSNMGPSGTRYCYTRTGNSYTVGVALESGTFFNLGTAAACSTFTI